MKRRIWKYTLDLADTQTVQIPEGAQILTAQFQGTQLCVWALVDCDPEIPKQNREIEIIGTGNPIIEAPRRYISTVQQVPFVWHVFERVS
jgi:hypothetical protein